jgi:hypothetical protein
MCTELRACDRQQQSQPQSMHLAVTLAFI